MSEQLEHRFEDYTVLVTGSNYGIGQATVERFAAEGAEVVVTGRDEERCRQVATGINNHTGGEATAISADLSDPAAIEALINTVVDVYGGINVLVNNAAAQIQQTITDTPLNDWAQSFNVNLRAYWLTVKHALAHILNGGTVINVSSNHSLETGPSMFPYNVTKTAVHGLTRAMALELGPAIRVNTVSSGWVPTGEERKRYETGEIFEDIDDIHPVGRMGRPEDIAGVVTFLASDDAAFVTGSRLVADGGRSAIMYDDWAPNYSDRDV